jgi:hypothetical protein
MRFPSADLSQAYHKPFPASSACGKFSHSTRRGAQDALRRLLKFLHTIGAIGLMGSMASLLVLMSLTPPPASRGEYSLICLAMADIAAFILLPSIAVTLAAGLLAIAANRAFHNAGWAWVKAATGILIFAGGLHALAPIQEEARRSAEAPASQTEAAASAVSPAGEQGTLWVLLAVSAANIALGVWRPRLTVSRANSRFS